MALRLLAVGLFVAAFVLLNKLMFDGQPGVVPQVHEAGPTVASPREVDTGPRTASEPGEVTPPSGPQLGRPGIGPAVLNIHVRHQGEPVARVHVHLAADHPKPLWRSSGYTDQDGNVVLRHARLGPQQLRIDTKLMPRLRGLEWRAGSQLGALPFDADNPPEGLREVIAKHGVDGFRHRLPQNYVTTFDVRGNDTLVIDLHDPVPKAWIRGRVTMLANTTGTVTVYHRDPGTATRGGSVIREATADLSDDGKFELEVHAGLKEVTAHLRRGRRWHAVAVHMIDTDDPLRAGETRDVGTLRFAADELTIRTQLIDEFGTTVVAPGATLRLDLLARRPTPWTASFALPPGEDIVIRGLTSKSGAIAVELKRFKDRDGRNLQKALDRAPDIIRLRPLPREVNIEVPVEPVTR